MNEIICSYLTLSGALFGYPPAYSLPERSEAAFRAGFSGIGATVSDYSQRTNLSVPVRELEWADLSRPEWESINTLFRFAESLGTVRQINAGSCGTITGGEANNLRTLAHIAGDHGIKVAIEPVSFGGFKTLDSVMKLIKEAGGENMGVLYDVWHVYRASGDLPFMDASAIASIQLSGNFRDYWPGNSQKPKWPAWEWARDYPSNLARTDAMNRTFPTTGVSHFYVAEFLRDVLADRYAGPVSAEIPTELLRENEITCEIMARAAYNSVTRVMCDAQRN